MWARLTFLRYNADLGASKQALRLLIATINRREDAINCLAAPELGCHYSLASCVQPLNEKADVRTRA